MENKVAYKKILTIIKSQIKLLKEGEMSTSQIEMRQELLKFFQSRLEGHSFEIYENPILNNLRMKGQTLRQKYQDNPLQ